MSTLSTNYSNSKAQLTNMATTATEIRDNVKASTDTRLFLIFFHPVLSILC